MRNSVFLTALVLLLAGCGVLRNAFAPSPPQSVPAPAPQAPAPPPPRPAVPAPTPAPAVAPTPAPAVAVPAPAPAVDNVYASGAAAMQEGRHERALDLFAEIWKDRPGHPGVTRDFPVALERLKRKGDDAHGNGRPEEAGRAWSASLAYLSHPAAKGRALPFTRSDLQGSIDRLTKSLMDKGLAEYREGRFESAIAVWQSILAYDPGNEEAAKSVRTATTQLENLKKIPPGK